jgi:hypothetical protein
MPWGGQKLLKIDKFRRRGPGTPFYKLFETLQIFAKTVQISTPKIDPIK